MHHNRLALYRIACMHTWSTRFALNHWKREGLLFVGLESGWKRRDSRRFLCFCVPGFKFVSSLGSQSYFADVFPPSPLPNNFLTDLWGHGASSFQRASKKSLTNHYMTWDADLHHQVQPGLYQKLSEFDFQYEVLRWDHLNNLHSVSD